MSAADPFSGLAATPTPLPPTPVMATPELGNPHDDAGAYTIADTPHMSWMAPGDGAVTPEVAGTPMSGIEDAVPGTAGAEMLLAALEDAPPRSHSVPANVTPMADPSAALSPMSTEPTPLMGVPLRVDLSPAAGSAAGFSFAPVASEDAPVSPAFPAASAAPEAEAPAGSPAQSAPANTPMGPARAAPRSFDASALQSALSEHAGRGTPAQPGPSPSLRQLKRQVAEALEAKHGARYAAEVEHAMRVAGEIRAGFPHTRFNDDGTVAAKTPGRHGVELATRRDADDDRDYDCDYDEAEECHAEEVEALSRSVAKIDVSGPIALNGVDFAGRHLKFEDGEVRPVERKLRGLPTPQGKYTVFE